MLPISAYDAESLELGPHSDAKYCIIEYPGITPSGTSRWDPANKYNKC